MSKFLILSASKITSIDSVDHQIIRIVHVILDAIVQDENWVYIPSDIYQDWPRRIIKEKQIYQLDSPIIDYFVRMGFVIENSNNKIKISWKK